jgi:hypothetical protein
MIRESKQRPQVSNGSAKACLKHRDRLDAKKVVEDLRCKGVEVTAEQAEAILKILRKLANITVSNYLRRPP